ncbi:MAG: phage major capsid protein [Oscillospiraceae bacterium]|nr:phage major capsid protein [Oscillospiraceae bacterium]
MIKILELREKRAKAWDTAKAFLDSKRSDDGILSAEDTATYEKMESEVVALGKEIDRLERQATIDAELSKPTSNPITNKPTTGDGEEKTGRATAEYKKAFWNAMRTKTPHSEVLNSLSIGTDSDGGYLVPDEFERILVAALEDENILRTLAHVITSSSGEKKIPVVASNGTASWVDEGDAIPESDDTFGQVNLGAHKLATMLKISEELLNDSAFNLEQYAAKEFGRRIGRAEEEAFIGGDGTGKPTGFLNSAQLGITTAGANISLDEMIDLYHSLREPYRRKAVFIVNDLTVKAIRKLKDTTGQYLWQPSLIANTPDTILGRPVKTSSFMPVIEAAKKVVAFGDFSYYWIADRQGRAFKRLNELYAANGQVGFLGS